LLSGGFFCGEIVSAETQTADYCFHRNNDESRGEFNCWWTIGCTWETGKCVPKGGTVNADGSVDVGGRDLQKARDIFKEITLPAYVVEGEIPNLFDDMHLNHMELMKVNQTADQLIEFCADYWDQFNAIGQGRCQKISEYLGKISIGSGSFFAPYTGPVFDGPGLKQGADIARNRLDHSISHEKDLKILAIGWSKFFLSLAAIVAVIALIYAGILFLTDFGSGTGSEKAKKIILWVVVGILLILGSYAIVNTVMKASTDIAVHEISPQIHIQKI